MNTGTQTRGDLDFPLIVRDRSLLVPSLKRTSTHVSEGVIEWDLIHRKMTISIIFCLGPTSKIYVYSVCCTHDGTC